MVWSQRSDIASVIVEAMRISSSGSAWESVTAVKRQKVALSSTKSALTMLADRTLHQKKVTQSHWVFPQTLIAGVSRDCVQRSRDAAGAPIRLEVGFCRKDE